MKYILASAFLAAAIAGALWLLIHGHVSEATFVILTCLAMLASAIILFYDRLAEFSIKDMRVVLREMQETQKDIKQREKGIKDLAVSVAELVVFFAAFNRYMSSAESMQLERKWVTKKVRSMIERSNIDSADAASVFRYMNETEKMESLKLSDKEEAKKCWMKMWEEIKKEAE